MELPNSICNYLFEDFYTEENSLMDNLPTIFIDERLNEIKIGK